MRVLIVDDEAPARARLARLLAAFADVQVAGEAADADTALALVAALQPDALLLDIQMPGASGLDVAASLPDPAPAVVFVTAFDAYALQAFDAAAIDYLLKPVDPDRLARAIERLRMRPPAVPRCLPPRQLLIPDRGRTHVVACAAIDWLEAADNYVVVHAGDRAPLIRRTLAALCADLGERFVRVHRRHAVAADRIRSIEVREKGDAVVVLHGGQRVPCSRQHRAALAAMLTARLAAPR